MVCGCTAIALFLHEGEMPLCHFLLLKSVSQFAIAKKRPLDDEIRAIVPLFVPRFARCFYVSQAHKIGRASEFKT